MSFPDSKNKAPNVFLSVNDTTRAPSVISTSSSSGGTVIVNPPPPPPPPPSPGLSVTPGELTGTINEVVIGPSITGTGPGSTDWSLSADLPGMTAVPSSGTLANGATVIPSLTFSNLATYSLILNNLSGGEISGSPGTVIISAAPPIFPDLLVAPGDSTGIVNTFISGPTITGAGPVPVNWQLTADFPGMTAVPSSGTLAEGQSIVPSLSFSSPATYVLSLDNLSGGIVSGSPGTVVISSPPPVIVPLTVDIDYFNVDNSIITSDMVSFDENNPPTI